MTDPTRPGESGAQAGGLSAVAVASILGGLLVAAAIALVVLRGDAPETAPPRTPTAAAPETAPLPETPGGSEASGPAETADHQAAEPVPDLRFDVVRVDRAGGAVIAGFAAPGASVTLTLDGAPVETVPADASGQFAAILALPPSEAPRILGLQAVLPGGLDLTSAQTVIIAPFAGEAVAAVLPPDPPPATRADPPGLGEATSTAPVLGGPGDDAQPATGAVADLAAAAPETAPAPETTLPAAPDTVPEPSAGATEVATETPTPAAEAPAVLLADGDDIRVLQGPGNAPEVTTDLRLDAITYDVAGDVTLAGRAPAEGSVRATLNNQPINMGEVGQGGQWSLDLPDVDPGTYTLRLEQLAADGSVTGRIETPFLREDPDRIRTNPMLVEPGASVITVQSGFTLWGIAEANFGDGIRYVQIFEENRDRIRDPDLIFPGQIFALPDLPRAVE